MKKKMCPKWKKGCTRYACPVNTNTVCEIIPAKKPDVVVKGWAWINNLKQSVDASDFKPWSKDSVPCKIVMTAANYKKLERK